MSIISSFMASLFGKKEAKALFVGLDGSGRTSLLYSLVLGEVITVMPTIGFNVESITVGSTNFTIWDIGGCDKIRPLWRHYYRGTDVIVYFIDSQDRSRLNEAIEFMHQTLEVDVLEHAVVLVLVTKQDLPNAISPEEVEQVADLERYRRRGQLVNCMGCSVQPPRDDIWTALRWAEEAFRIGRASLNSGNSGDGGGGGGGGSSSSGGSGAGAASSSILTSDSATDEKSDIEILLTEWLEREDEDDDVFLQKLEDATLDQWDHRTHLRIAWLLLSRHGRREGMKQIFDSIKSFIERSPRTRRADAATRGTTFHETMTYFWVHMVDYAMRATNHADGGEHQPVGNNFKHFLLFNPLLANGGLFLHYYSKHRMLLDPEARSSVLLPDIRSLPSLLTDVHSQELSAASANGAAATPLHLRLQPKAPQSDQEFLNAFEGDALDSWGHDIKIRLIYLLLTTTKSTEPELAEKSISGGRRPTEAVLSALQKVEKEYYNLTEAYFWLQLVGFHIAWMDRDLTTKMMSSGSSGSTNISLSAEEQEKSFDYFYRRPHAQPLRNPDLILKYYTKGVVYSDSAATEFTLPDIKPLPSKLPSSG